MMFSMPNIKASDTLLLCHGSSCAKKQRSAFNRLSNAATRAGLDPVAIKCQGSCEGPTAVLHIGGTYQWFERLGSKGAQADLLELAVGDRTEASNRLKKRELTGKQRAKAARKLGVA